MPTIKSDTMSTTAHFSVRESVRHLLRRSVRPISALTLSGACSFVFVGASSLVQAQENNESTQGLIEEVTVTARKRAENLQDVPISVQVVGSQTLQTQNLNSLTDLARTVPGVSIERGNQTNRLFMRGIGSGVSPSFDQSVSMFIDGIYYGRGRLSGASFLDLNRVEFLKGPQTTFFGNSAIAGAINVVSEGPGDAFSAWARALYGTDDDYALEGAVGGPVTERFGIRAAMSLNGTNGWIDNVYTGRRIPQVDNKAARLTFSFKATDDLDATLKLEGSHNETEGAPTETIDQITNCPPPAPFPPGYSSRGICQAALNMNLPMGLDSNQVSTIGGESALLKTGGAVLTANYRWAGHTFTSVTGFNKYDYEGNIDAGNLPSFQGTYQVPEKYRQFSQELRVTSPSDQEIEYLVGAYFQDDRLEWNSPFNLPLLTPVVMNIPAFSALIPYLPLALNYGSVQDEKVYSIFGSLGWNATDRLKLNVGLRGIKTDKSFLGSMEYGTATQLYGGFVPMPPAAQALATLIVNQPAGTQNLSRSDSYLMRSAGIQYKYNPETMLYFSYDRGFKAGGFNGVTPTGVTGNPGQVIFGPEYVDAYELGIKKKWFDDSLLTNIAVFRSEYQGLQVEANVLNPSTGIYNGVVQNAGSSVSEGVELEVKWAATRNFQLGANVTYLDSTYKVFPNGVGKALQVFCANNYVLPYCSGFTPPISTANSDRAGDPTNFSPKWSAGLSAGYRYELPNNYEVLVELTPFYTDTYNNDPQLDALGLRSGTPSYTRLDGRISLSTPDGRGGLDLIGKNLTDRVIGTYGTNFFHLGSKQRLRTLALQARYSW